MPRPRIYETMKEAVADFAEGASLMVPGFGTGSPWNLMGALYEQGATGIRFITNSINVAAPREDVKAPRDFVLAGRAAGIIASFTESTRPSRRGEVEDLVRDGVVQVELMPQGTLAERIRAGGAGIPAFYTPAGVGTLDAEGKEYREFDGRGYVLERALFADYAFIRAHRADEVGNLMYRMAARNFNPIMAMAARTVIVEVEEPIVPAGTFAPDEVHTPGVYVHRLVQIPADGVFGADRRLTLAGIGTPRRDGARS